MFSPLRNRFGIPGVISVIALVFAMLGGAYAASNSGSGNSKASASAVKKGPRGPRGPKGPAGPAGAQGPAGPQGAKGDTGANGKDGADGANGTNGTNGTSATTASFAGAKGSCTEGGVEVKSASPAVLVCNGVQGTNGTNGANGSPWTAGGTLPPGATETGAWLLTPGTKFSIPFVGDFPGTAISFPLPLPAALDGTKVHFIEEGGTVPSECNNGVGLAPSAANPEADPDQLCVFATTASGSTSIGVFDLIGEEGAEKTGALLLEVSGATSFFASGTYAVTGPSPGP